MATPPPECSDHQDEVVTDLVEYFIVAVPNVAALAGLACAVVQVITAASVRVLDLVVVEKGEDGMVTATELESVEWLAAVRNLLPGRRAMLSEHDIALASVALRAGSAGLVVVAEDRWAQPLSAAARVAGGRIVAGERIPAVRVASALGTDPLPPGGEEDDRAEDQRSTPQQA